MARKLKIASEWYRKGLAAHKRAMVQPMRPQSYKPNANAKATEYALWLLARDGIELTAGEIRSAVEWDTCAAGKRPRFVEIVIKPARGAFTVHKVELPNWSFVAEAPAEQLELAA